MPFRYRNRQPDCPGSALSQSQCPRDWEMGTLTPDWRPDIRGMTSSARSLCLARIGT